MKLSFETTQISLIVTLQCFHVKYFPLLLVMKNLMKHIKLPEIKKKSEINQDTVSTPPPNTGIVCHSICERGEKVGQSAAELLPTVDLHHCRCAGLAVFSAGVGNRIRSASRSSCVPAANSQTSFSPSSFSSSPSHFHMLNHSLDLRTRLLTRRFRGTI